MATVRTLPASPSDLLDAVEQLLNVCGLHSDTPTKNSRVFQTLNVVDTGSIGIFTKSSTHICKIFCRYQICRFFGGFPRLPRRVALYSSTASAGISLPNLVCVVAMSPRDTRLCTVDSDSPRDSAASALVMSVSMLSAIAIMSPV